MFNGMGNFGNMVKGFFGNTTGPTDPFGQSSLTMHHNLDPYINQGQNALNQYYSGSMAMKDPSQFYENMMKNYQESPEAKYQIAQGIKSANAAGAASGMLGSGAEMTALQRQGQNIIGQDQQNWLNNMMNIYGKYLGGMGGISHMGLGAGEDQSQLQNQLSNWAAQQAWAKHQQNRQDTGAWGGLAGGVLGTMFGGPAGGMMGSQIGSGIGASMG